MLSSSSQETIPLTGTSSTNKPNSDWKGKGQPLGSSRRTSTTTEPPSHTEEQTRAARLEALERRRPTTTYTEADEAANQV
jgi:hypothetical protein